MLIIFGTLGPIFEQDSIISLSGPRLRVETGVSENSTRAIHSVEIRVVHTARERKVYFVGILITNKKKKNTPTMLVENQRFFAIFSFSNLPNDWTRAPGRLSKRFRSRFQITWTRAASRRRINGTVFVSLAATRERDTLLTRAPEGTGDAACRRDEPSASCALQCGSAMGVATLTAA